MEDCKIRIRQTSSLESYLFQLLISKGLTVLLL